MKQRTTFLIPKSAPFITPESLEYDGETLRLNEVEAWRQERWTVGVEEVPEILRNTFSQLDHLEARWQSKESGDRVNPFAGSTTPGAHFFVEAGGAEEDAMRLLCTVIKMVSLKKAVCNGLESFVHPPNSPTHHFFTPDSHPAELAATAKILLCKHLPETSKASCLQATSQLSTADSIEITYTKSTGTIVVSALWTSSPEGTWNSALTPASHRHEVGVLDERRALEPNEIALGGVIAVLGDSKELSETLLSFPAHHFSHPGSYHAHFTLPTNIHPVLNLAIDLPSPPPREECTLNAYFTTPNFAFVDKYQLSDPQFLASQNLTKLIGPFGDTDLEAPQWTAGKWGSEFVLGLNTNDIFPPALEAEESTDVEVGSIQDLEKDLEKHLEKDLEKAEPQGGLLNVKVPLHTRYIPPVDGQDATVPHALPFPAVFYACPPLEASESASTAKNPFKPASYGFESYFAKDTTFHHISPAYQLSEASEARMEIPTLGMINAQVVRTGTVLVVVGCVTYLCVVMARSLGLLGGKKVDGGKVKKTQ
ncbi:PIG-X-domain-containing protein [Ascobolus immersus RN42]|uniref:Protein PBN1 n=1 Tax=Ascobolus immersus RN42 TaxID=1160509 RepID=A0A3N4HIE3_ASCIM|nr:PIG-X-domain-containing protein [Ascobolus immersus RN42]